MFKLTEGKTADMNYVNSRLEFVSKESDRYVYKDHQGNKYFFEETQTEGLLMFLQKELIKRGG